MYSSFNVRNFRGFAKLSFNDFSRINLIAGKNNSGKTALMEAIYIHSGSRSPKTLLRSVETSDFEYYLLRSRRGIVNRYDISSWNSLFYDFDTQNDIELTAEFDTEPRPIHGGDTGFSLHIGSVLPDREDFLEILQEYKAEDDDDVHVLEFVAGFDNNPYHMLLSDERIRFSRTKRHVLLQSDFLHTREPINPKNDNDRLADMKQAKTESILIEALQMLEPRLSSLEILYERIHADVGISKSIPLTSMGDGMNRTASMILAMSKVPNGVIFIDEIENGLHHTIQEGVWKILGKLARDANIQVFATTHSLEMLQAAHQAFKDDEPYEFRFHRLDRDIESGNVKAVTYNEFGMNALAEFDFDHEVRG